MELDDPRWTGLKGGYRTPYDPRDALRKIEAGRDVGAAWHELWDELHHQGDVGEASYASIPQLVRIHKTRDQPDWNTYALVAIIELARRDERNPALPSWLQSDYSQALDQLSHWAIRDLARTGDQQTVLSILAVLAVLAFWKGARVSGGLLARFSEDELQEMEEAWYGREDAG